MVKKAETNKEGEEKWQEKQKTLKVLTLQRERERERATSREISFICAAKINMNKIDYRTEIKKLRFISVLQSIFCAKNKKEEKKLEKQIN